MTMSKRQHGRASMLCLLLMMISLVHSNGMVMVERATIVPGTNRLRNEHNHLQNNMYDAKARTITSSTPPRRLRRLDDQPESIDDQPESIDERPPEPLVDFRPEPLDDRLPESLDDRLPKSLDYHPSESLFYSPETLEKWVPDKGDTTDCQSILDRWYEHLEDHTNSTRMPPCRNGTIVNETVIIERDPPGFSASGEGTDTGPIFNGMLPDDNEAGAELVKRRNGVSVGFAVALRPESVPHPFIVTRILTSVLNEAVEDIDFFVYKRRQLYEEEGRQSGEGQEKVHEAEGQSKKPEGPLLEPQVPLLEPQVPLLLLEPQVQLLGPQGSLLGPLGQSYDPKEITALYDMYYLRTTVRTGRRLPEQWWWRYDFVYLCYLKESGLAVTNRTLLQSITADINVTLERVISSGIIRSRIIDEAKEAVLDVSIDEEAVLQGASVAADPTEIPTSIIANGTDVVQAERGPTYPNPLDVQGWDYRRWLGLGLFCGTVVATLLLTQVASHRKRRRTAKEMWGNLGTEEGVDELLRTGWKVKGSNMEVYDKAKLGYTDNDSILMGGFEQKHEVVGAEITVTQSTTTPDTGNRS